MISIRESVFIKYEGAVNVMRMELEVDTASELPSADYFDGHSIYQGSIAHDISTGDFYAIDSSGAWYKQNGSGEYSAENAQVSSSPRQTIQPISNTLKGSLNNTNESEAITDNSATEETVPEEANEALTEDVPDISDGELIEEKDIPVDLTEDRESEGTGELMEEAPDSEQPVTDNVSDSEEVTDEEGI